MTSIIGAQPGLVTPKKIATKVKTKATKSISTVDSTGDDLALTTSTLEARVDTRLLANALGNKHKAVVTLLDRYQNVFKQHGQLTFKKEVGERRQGGGNAERYALLNENQANFLLNLSRNTDIVVALKSKLITAFSNARRAADMRQTEYLPSYHQLQDAIHEKSATASNEGLVHMNIAKLLNKSMGIEAGQRGSMTIPKQALMIVAHTVASRAMQAALDHRDGYQRIKQSMLALNSLALEVNDHE